MSLRVIPVVLAFLSGVGLVVVVSFLIPRLCYLKVFQVYKKWGFELVSIVAIMLMYNRGSKFSSLKVEKNLYELRFQGFLIRKCMDTDLDITSYIDVAGHAFGRKGRV
ncbi:hypothetical protein Ddye_022978 [Dipteronia dyeriana]|uniref:Uncharacterized protein n=1 Tax=Dipteronia dyeriana TaxID=168575 RepID=A0AAD9TT14_9ROSI|nr:hypothetical protein Ddye_022978 [Dipteronia dyeriana]